MNNTFTLNGLTVSAREFNFNALCDLDNYGISIQDVGDKPMAFVRAYIALCMNTSLEEAGQNVNDHIVNGGTLDDIFAAINKELENSGFFHALQDRPEGVQKKTPTSKKATK